VVALNDPDTELAAAIISRCGRAGPGARLPAERQLAAEMGVTRSALRRAMAVLEEQGRISREVGRGTFLRDDGVASSALPGPGALPGTGTESGNVADSGVLAGSGGHGDFAPADVMLVRRMFEPQVMPLVVAWATARDFAEMDRCLYGGEHASGYAEFEDWDAALHRHIVAASHSPLLVRMYAQVEAARHGRVWGDLKKRSASPARLAEYHRDHLGIVAALKLRDADRAVSAMRGHLARVSRYLLGGE
jgi:GntR family transcriptional regulator, uxu operon transcriptional repressor